MVRPLKSSMPVICGRLELDRQPTAVMTLRAWINLPVPVVSVQTFDA